LEVEQGCRAAKVRLLKEEREEKKRRRGKCQIKKKKEKERRRRGELRRVTRSSSNVRKVRPLPNPAATTL